jgi:hypothetical protein
VQSILPIGRKLADAFEQPLVLIDVERRLGVFGIGKSCQIYPHLKHASNPMKIGLAA